MTAPTLIHWAIALAPVLLLLVVFEWLDVFHLIGVREVSLLLLLGGLAGLISYPVSGRLLDAMPLGFSTYSRFVAPWIEEALKGAAVVLLFARNRVGFKLDAAISGFAIGAGFSVVENCLYLIRFAELDFGVWLVRGFGTAVMHGGAVALMASLSHQLNERAARRQATNWRFHLWYFIPGYLVAVAVHTLFNQFPAQPLFAMLGALLLLPAIILVIFRYGETEASGWLAAETINHRAALDELRSGSFPDTASGRLVETLAGRASGRASPEMMRRYLEVHTELVLRAELMLEEHHATGTAADRKLFAELDALKAQLGRTTLSLIAPLLPFSREELWEMHELRSHHEKNHRPPRVSE